jgi:predicted lipoprotein with Yx(FWY)xxD motif
LTLYHLTTDTSTKTTCTGGCAQVWPPLLATNGDPPSSPGLDTFGTINRPDSSVQVTFNGMLLYTYAGDSQPGQASGQGIGGTWFAVTS